MKIRDKFSLGTVNLNEIRIGDTFLIASRGPNVCIRIGKPPGLKLDFEKYIYWVDLSTGECGGGVGDSTVMPINAEVVIT